VTPSDASGETKGSVKRAETLCGTSVNGGKQTPDHATHSAAPVQRERGQRSLGIYSGKGSLARYQRT
jgi:hypothetical protein